MGSACCVAARDTTPLPRRIISEFSSINIRFSPTWNCRWDSQGHVADDVENPSSVYSHGSGNIGFGMKDSIDVECGDLSERQSQENFLTTVVQKSSSHEEASEASAESSSINEVKGIIESLAFASSLAPASRLSFSVPQTPSTASNEEMSSQRCSLPIDSTPCLVRHSPGYHPMRPACSLTQLGFRYCLYRFSTANFPAKVLDSPQFSSCLSTIFSQFSCDSC